MQTLLQDADRDAQRHYSDVSPAVETIDGDGDASWQVWAATPTLPRIARCILATLKYEPHIVDTTALRRALKA